MKPLDPDSLAPGIHLSINSESTIAQILENYPLWKHASTPSGFSIYCITVEKSEIEEQPPVAISHFIAISNGTWRLWIRGQLVVKDTVPVLQHLPDVLDATALKHLMSMLETTPVCQGFQDNQILQFAKSKAEHDILTQLAVGSQCGVFRSMGCSLLLHGRELEICQVCKTLKHQLQAKVARQENKEATNPPKNTPNVALSTPQKLAKLATLARDKHAALQKVAHRIVLLYFQLQMALLSAKNWMLIWKPA